MSNISRGLEERWAKAWNDRFHQLAEFKRKFGHLPQKRSDHQNLHLWMTRQREKKEMGKLDLERRDKLTSIGFEWKRSRGPKIVIASLNKPPTERKRAKSSSNDARTDYDVQLTAAERRIRKKWDQAWMRNLEKVKKFKATHGHLKLPRTGLSQWIHDQRKTYRKQKLSESRYKKLEALGFDWTSRKSPGPKSVSRTWEVMYDELKAYKRKHKHVDVSNNKENRELYSWLNQQKQQIESRTLESSKRKKLIRLGVNLNVPTQGEWCNKQWSKHYNELCFHKEKNGHIRLSKHECKPLYEWVAKQRRKFRTGQLVKDRLDRLNALDDSWLHPSNDKLCQQEDEKKHVAKAKSKASPTKQQVNIATRTQVTAEFRQVKENSKSCNDVAWDNKYEELVAFKTNHGHLYISSEENNPLRHWLSRQRQRYREGKLEPDRYYRLNELGKGWLDRSVAKEPEDEPTASGGVWLEQWMEQFVKLKAFVAANGNDVRPYWRNPLYKWIRWQRERYLELKLENERVDLLNSIGFRWIAPMAPNASSKRSHEETFGSSEEAVAASSKRPRRGEVEMKPAAATKPAGRTVEAASSKGEGELESVCIATTDQAAKVDELAIRPRFTPTQRHRNPPSPVNVSVPTWTTVSTSDLSDVIDRLLIGSIVDKDTAYKHLKVQRY